VLDRAETPAPGVGALRLRLVAVRHGAAPFALRGDDGKYLQDVLLDLDYWVLIPR
jgi:2-methylfumaryl-CoA hydratase